MQFVYFLANEGTISLKQVLPVKKLNFGQINFAGGSHTLGKLVCTGKSVSASQHPESCRDLWRIGHTLNGFYTIRGDKHVELVHCDFSSGD